MGIKCKLVLFSDKITLSNFKKFLEFFLTSSATSNNHKDGSVNNFYNSTGDFVELICDGTDWYAHGMTKNRSVYKIIGSNIVYTY